MPDNLQDKLQATLGDAYTLERELSGGGMSRVFVAEDNALGRKIVVKMLPPETAAGVSVERFKREIQVVARLQHPHIVPVLSAGQIDGLPFYTMPFVKGESLRARLSRGGEMSVNEAIHVLRDVAAALAYAHGEGVVHRDIKPDNVILSGGVAVVTDFGVSKAVDVAATEGGRHATGITSFGIALGTPAYMSPEQASADPQVDHRADIYSFGCLAYELMAGTSPFGGRPPQQMLAAHVTEAPEPLTKRRPSVPPLFSALVMKCLEKRAGDRPQSAEELLTSLDAIATPSGGIVPTSERLMAVGRNHAKWIAVAAVTVAVVALGAQAWGRLTTTKPYAIGATTPVAISPDLEGQPAVSPDGKLVAFTAQTSAGSRIFARQIDGGRASMLTGELEGDHTWPHWSPDGSRISFEANGAIYIVPALTGGSPKRIVEGAIGFGHSWSHDGKLIVYAAADGIRLRALDGDTARLIATGDFLHSPVLSPDNRVVAYVAGQPPSFVNVSTSSIWSAPADGGTPTRISDSTHVNLSPVWTPDGKSVLFVSNMGGTRDVYQQAVSASGRLRGAATRITTALSSYTISLSADGTRMAYDVVRNYSNIWVATIGLTTTSMSAARQVTRDNQHIESLSLSRDGKWLAYDSDRGGNFDIYKLRVDGGDPVQLTTHPGNDFAPAWSFDGTRIAFHSPRSGTRDIYVVGAEGTAEQQVTSGPTEDYSPDWSPDGQALVYQTQTGFQSRTWLVARSRGGWSAPRRLTSDTLFASFPAWSPDGKLIAFVRRGAVPSRGGSGGLGTGTGVAVSSPDGSGVRVLATNRELGGIPSYAGWGRDASTVYVFVTQGSRSVVLALPVTRGAPRIVLAEEPNALFGRFEFAIDGSWLYFTRAAWESDVWVMELKR